MLEHKTAVIHGGGGAIGGAVARAFTSAGARVYLAGRSRARLEADGRRATGGPAQARLRLARCRHGAARVLWFITEVKNQGTCEAPCSTNGPRSTGRSPPR